MCYTSIKTHCTCLLKREGKKTAVCLSSPTAMVAIQPRQDRKYHVCIFFNLFSRMCNK